MSIVTDLFDDPEHLTELGDPYSRARHGTHGGVARHRRDGTEVCDECRSFKRKYHAVGPLDAGGVTPPTGTGKPNQEAAKLLFFHRMERARLQASLTDEERARLAAS